MAKIPIYRWVCDGPMCLNKFEDNSDMGRYISIPEGWAEISITQINEEEMETPDCTCKCHDDEYEEDEYGDDVNVAGHENYECEVCPEDKEWVMSSTLCPNCYSKFQMQWNLPREEK